MPNAELGVEAGLDTTVNAVVHRNRRSQGYVEARAQRHFTISHAAARIEVLGVPYRQIQRIDRNIIGCIKIDFRELVLLKRLIVIANIDVTPHTQRNGKATDLEPGLQNQSVIKGCPPEDVGTGNIKRDRCLRRHSYRCTRHEREHHYTLH